LTNYKYSQSELFSKLASVLLLWFECVKEGQLDDVRPHSRAGGATCLADQLELRNLLLGLEYRLPSKQLTQYTPRNEMGNHACMISGFFISRFYCKCLCLTYKILKLTDMCHRPTYPILQMSMEGPYRSSPSSSSGGRYHNVITLFVYRRLLSSASYSRPRPQSPSFI